MAALNFPATDGQAIDGSFQYSENNVTYFWNGTAWKLTGDAFNSSLYYTKTESDDKFVELAGDEMTGSVTVDERTITDAADGFDLSTGPYWTAGAIDIPNPTNAVAGMGGLIRLTDAPTSWGDQFTFVNDVAPSGVGTIPFYVVSDTEISLGHLTPGA
jgi:hypothetical protein